MKGYVLSMKKILTIFLLYLCLGLTACKSKEEAMAEIKEVSCEEAGIGFTLNGLWAEASEEEITIETKEGQTVALSVFQKSTGSGIDIICEDLTQTDGGILVRMDDYVAALQEQLKIAGDYSYSCGEVTTEKVYGNNYESFTAVIPELNGTQKYYIRRQEDTMIVMIVTVFGEEKIEDIMSLGKEM